MAACRAERDFGSEKLLHAECDFGFEQLLRAERSATLALASIGISTRVGAAAAVARAEPSRAEPSRASQVMCTQYDAHYLSYCPACFRECIAWREEQDVLCSAVM